MKDISVLNSRLTKLDLSNQNLTEIPNDVFRFKRLKVLKLSGNKLKRLPTEISILTNLERLDLSNNQITILHASIGKLTNLKVLNINNNKIKSFPKQLNLSELEALSIANNKFKDDSIDFESLISLKKLNISGNPLTKFPFNRGQTFHKLEYLWMNNLKLIDISNLIEFVQREIAPLKGIYAYSKTFKESNQEELLKKITRNKGNSLRLLRELNINKAQKTNKSINKRNNMNSLGETNKKESKSTKVFISYSHKDKAWLTEVTKHLKVLKRKETAIDVWADTEIKAGDKWKDKITDALTEAKIAILLISTDFLNSDFIIDNELPPLLEAAQKNGTKILSLILKPCLYDEFKELSQFQAVNSPNTPLIGCTDNDKEQLLVKLARDVKENIK